MARVKKTGHELKSRGTSEKDGVRVSNGTSVEVAARVEKPWHELNSRGTSCSRVRVARLARVLKLLPKRYIFFRSKFSNATIATFKNGGHNFAKIVKVPA